MNLRAVDHIGGAIAWRALGEGPPILLLHGLGGTRYAWEPQLEGLADRFRTIAWDMPGYGDSSPLVPLTFAGIADAIGRLLDQLELERSHIVGLSFGGQQAIHFALRHPDRVDHLVLADTSHRFGADGTDPEEWKRIRLDALDAGRTPAEIAEAVIDSVTGPRFGGIERDRLVAAFGRISSAGLRASIECLPSHNVTDRLGAITAPTLVIVGELDEETPPGYAETIAAGIPNADLAIIDGVGHLTPSEAPSDFNRLVADFLDHL